MAASSSSSSCNFNRFEVLVSCPVDHYFYDRKSTNLRAKAQKHIAKEWKILEESLPRGSIYVRAYETRMDLMRAVIVGAKGTPYHDGLFFFDFRFPLNYPNTPPEVRYRSHGMNINPNIYDNGKLCLSLLNTWPGSASENWDPSKSTVLQVLVSVQGLVLNSNPYVNEPMAHILGKPRESHCRNYNERVFVLSCKTALCLLRTRPQDFDHFVETHYRDRHTNILEACRAYSSGTLRVGLYGSALTSTSTACEVSDRFKKKVPDLYKLLVEAFVENSIQICQDLVEFEVKKDHNNKEEEELHGCGIIEWFRGFFKSKKF